MRKALILVALVSFGSFAVQAQTPQTTTCRSLESTGNFVGPDEVIVDGNACKVAKSTQPQATEISEKLMIRHPVQPGTTVNNARVVELTKLGLDDDIIIAKIRGQKCQFLMDDTDLVDLKRAGISPKVSEEMTSA